MEKLRSNYGQSHDNAPPDGICRRVMKNHLLVNKCREVIFRKHFVCHLQQNLRSELFDASEHRFGGFVFIIVQESLAHTQGVILVIIRSHAYLSDQLLFSGGKLGRGHFDIAHALQLLID